MIKIKFKKSQLLHKNIWILNQGFGDLCCCLPLLEVKKITKNKKNIILVKSTFEEKIIK